MHSDSKNIETDICDDDFTEEELDIIYGTNYAETTKQTKHKHKKEKLV